MIVQEELDEYLQGCQNAKEWKDWVDTRSREIMTNLYKAGMAVEHTDGTTGVITELAQNVSRGVLVCKVRLDGIRGKPRVFDCEEMLTQFKIITGAVKWPLY